MVELFDSKDTRASELFLYPVCSPPIFYPMLNQHRKIIRLSELGVLLRWFHESRHRSHVM